MRRSRYSGAVRSVVGLDSDISDWYVSGMYVGLGLQGSAVQTCIVDSVDFLQTEM